MKKISVVYILLCVGLTSFAQEAKHNIKTNLLSPFLNTLNISYEVLKPNDKSIQFGLSFMNYNGYLSSETNYDYGYGYGYEENVKGVAATFEYRILRVKSSLKLGAASGSRSASLGSVMVV